MDNTTLNAFVPLATAIVAQVFQLLVKRGPLQLWRTMIITAVFVIVATVFTFAMISNATKCAIASSGWVPFSNFGKGSTITVARVEDCALQVSFDLKGQGGQVAIYKKVDTKLLKWWIEGIEFSYFGTGDPNTMEFQLLDTASSGYKLVPGQTTNTGGKFLPSSIPFEELRATAGGKMFKRAGFDLDRIDFTFSSGPNDTPGRGYVTIRDIRIRLSWTIRLLIWGPVLLMGITIAAYSLWQKRGKKEGPKQDKQRERVSPPKRTQRATAPRRSNGRK